MMSDLDVWHTTVLHLEPVQVQIYGQGYRSKFKVTRWKKNYFFTAVNKHYKVACFVGACYDVTYVLLACLVLCIIVVSMSMTRGAFQHLTCLLCLQAMMKLCHQLIMIMLHLLHYSTLYELISCFCGLMVMCRHCTYSCNVYQHARQHGPKFNFPSQI